MDFIEIYYSSFSRNTLYSKKPEKIKELARVLKETENAGPILKTIAIVTFTIKRSMPEACFHFKRLDFKSDKDKIDKLIRKSAIRQQVLELK